MYECKDEEEQKKKLEDREADVMLSSSVTYLEEGRNGYWIEQQK